MCCNGYVLVFSISVAIKGFFELMVPENMGKVDVFPFVFIPRVCNQMHCNQMMQGERALRDYMPMEMMTMVKTEGVWV